MVGDHAAEARGPVALVLDTVERELELRLAGDQVLHRSHEVGTPAHRLLALASGLHDLCVEAGAGQVTGGLLDGQWGELGPVDRFSGAGGGGGERFVGHQGGRQ